MLRAADSRSTQSRRENQSRLLPISLHGALGDVQCLGNFLLAVTAEVAHLGDLRQAGFGFFQILERFVNSQNGFFIVRDIGGKLGG